MQIRSVCKNETYNALVELCNRFNDSSVHTERCVTGQHSIEISSLKSNCVLTLTKVTLLFKVQTVDIFGLFAPNGVLVSTYIKL